MSKTKAQLFVDATTLMGETYRKKNSDYGNSFSKLYAEFGMISPVIKLSDKLERLKSLGCPTAWVEKSPEVQEESIEDTLLDLANYAILTLVERQYSKQPREENATRCENGDIH